MLRTKFKKQNNIMKVTYHQTHSFQDDMGKNHELVTQFYQTGIYAVLDNKSSSQMSFDPKELKKLEKKLINYEKAGKISKLSFGGSITVSDESGVWKIVSRGYAPTQEGEQPFEIFIHKNKTYVAKHQYKGVTYQFTVVKITKDKTDIRESLVEFTVSPECSSLYTYSIGENLHRAGVVIFQGTINKKPIVNNND